MVEYQVQYERELGYWTVCILDENDNIFFRLVCENRRQADLIAQGYSEGTERYVVVVRSSHLTYIVYGTCSRKRDLRRILTKLPQFYSLTTLTTLAA